MEPLLHRATVPTGLELCGLRHHPVRLGHMIEECVRHNGHAAVIRESVDGETGNSAATMQSQGCTTRENAT